MKTIGLSVVFALAIGGCQRAPQPTTTPAPSAKASALALDGFAVIAMGANARYIIDRRSESCFLMIGTQVQRVNCATLRKNMPAAAAHITWRRKEKRKRRRTRFGPTKTRMRLRTPGTSIMPRVPPPSRRWHGVVRIGPLETVMTRAALTRLLRSPGSSIRGVRIVPSLRNGKPNGIKLYAVRPSSLYATVGLRNGDTLTAVNGHPISTSPDKALELYTKIKAASTLRLDMIHRGKKRVVRIHIRPTFTLTFAERRAFVAWAIHKRTAENYQVRKGLMDVFVDHSNVFASSARIVATVRNGKPDGVKLYGLRSDSLFVKLGLHNGDTIHSINGEAITSVSGAAQVFKNQRNKSRWDVALRHRGKAKKLVFTFM